MVWITHVFENNITNHIIIKLEFFQKILQKDLIAVKNIVQVDENILQFFLIKNATSLQWHFKNTLNHGQIFNVLHLGSDQLVDAILPLLVVTVSNRRVVVHRLGQIARQLLVNLIKRISRRFSRWLLQKLELVRVGMV